MLLSTIASDLERVAEGGEGTVYRLRTQPRVAYKQYKDMHLSNLNVDALRGLIDLPQQLPAPDRATLMSRTVWPKTMVLQGTQVVGFVMDAIDSRFMRRHGLRAAPKEVLCDWNQLIYQGQPMQPHMVSEVPRLKTTDTVALVKDLADTMDLMHRNGIVVGDMSGKNLIWTSDPPQVLIIDCDSFRLEGSPGVCGPKESPGWIDHSLRGGPTSKESDIYKLGVAAYRSLWHEPNGDVTSQAVMSTAAADVPHALVTLIAASVAPSGRPSSGDWVRTLKDLYKYGGRKTLAVTQMPVAPASPAPPTPVPRPAVTAAPKAARPRITLRAP